MTGIASTVTTKPGHETGNVHFSNQTDLWATPQWLYDKLDLEFHFTVDLCATPENAKCAGNMLA